jgi:hypothetical protein
MSIFSETFFTIFVNTLHNPENSNENMGTVSIQNSTEYSQESDLAYFLQNSFGGRLEEFQGCLLSLIFKLNDAVSSLNPNTADKTI